MTESRIGSTAEKENKRKGHRTSLPQPHPRHFRIHTESTRHSAGPDMATDVTTLLLRFGKCYVFPVHGGKVILHGDGTETVVVTVFFQRLRLFNAAVLP